MHSSTSANRDGCRTNPLMPLFKKILVANRSEIAVRVMNACRNLGIPTVAVYSDADVKSKHRFWADESVHIGPSSPRESYLDIENILQAARSCGCDAIHPGYGFLSENPLFARRCRDENIIFIGPSPEAIKLLGNKVESRMKMSNAGVPLIPGMKTSSPDIAVYRKVADEAGYPVIVKAAAGGGGKGMRVVPSAGELEEAVSAARREALNAFGDDTVYVEKYLVNPRHIEFQILADSHGNAIHLFERECSIQRRHQKIIEETPSTALTPELRKKMGETAVTVAKAAGYTNAGTVEFLLDESGKYYFLEVNTRLQVEHPITEAVTGVDLVVEQIQIAAGLPISESTLHATQRGHAIECRIYAEDGENNFFPSSGNILYYHEPSGPGIRVDSGIWTGSEITIDYDPIMAKVIVLAPTRDLAIAKMREALNAYKILGVRNAKKFMIDILTHPEFAQGRTYTSFIDIHFADRAENATRDRGMAVAATAVFGEQRVASSSGSTPASMPTPWETLGSWQVGGSIL
jgi:acetyl-CoA carboxylase biotin carboxylase subunit